MSDVTPARPTRAELESEGGTTLPTKEVISLLNLNLDADLALALAAPIDLAVAANAQAALPIDASLSSNLLSDTSTATSAGLQTAGITQGMSAVEADADALQTATIAQDADTGSDGGSTGDISTSTGDVSSDDTSSVLEDTTSGLTDSVDDVTAAVEGALSDGLLNVDVQIDLDADLTAPIAGAVAANAQVAAPVNASLAVNLASLNSEAVSLSEQTAVITQDMTDVVATATADQAAEIDQAADSGGTTEGEVA